MEKKYKIKYLPLFYNEILKFNEIFPENFVKRKVVEFIN